MNDITEVDRLNAEIADLKRTIEWYQGRTGIMMGEAAGAALAAVPASDPVALSEHDLDIIRDIEAMAVAPNDNWWSKALALGASRIIKNLRAAAPVPVSGAVVAHPDLAKLLDHINEFPEINMGNYGEDEVSTLNNWGMELIDLARAIPSPQAPTEPHPLDGLHINRGSMDAAADAYFREWQKSKCRTAYENRYHKVKALCPYDEWEACWFKALAAATVPSAK